MSSATVEPTAETVKPAPVAQPNCPVTVTEKAASEVQRAIADYRSSGDAPTEELYLRIRVTGGGCSGFQNKLDLDPNYNEKLDVLFEVQGIKLLIDKRSLLYLDGATIDFIDDLNKRGFHINQPNVKGTCGCGSSYTM
jgi:iron-sulfur cluster assembly protein